MAPHGIYRAAGDDEWVAIACRSDADWAACAAVIDRDWARESRWSALSGRLGGQDELDALLNEWCGARSKFDVQRQFQAAGVPAAAVQKPEERIEHDPSTAEFGLWPSVRHSKIGDIRVDGLPVRFSATPWSIARGGPCVGEHTEEVLTDVLGLSAEEVATLRKDGVV
jgi:crotonobetainyl-CoA:carnitine CoA-transferase CaiB-like acyl-CoA transferase